MLVCSFDFLVHNFNISKNLFLVRFSFKNCVIKPRSSFFFYIYKVFAGIPSFFYDLTLFFETIPLFKYVFFFLIALYDCMYYHHFNNTKINNSLLNFRRIKLNSP